MNSQQSEKQPTKLASIVSWTLGSLFAILGLGMISSQPLPAIIMCAMAAILIPKVSQQIEQKLKIKISTGHKVPLILIGMVLFSLTIEKKDNTPQSRLVSSTQTTISAPSIPTNTQVATIDPAATVKPKPTPTTQENTNSIPTEARTNTTNAQVSPQTSITATPVPEQRKLLGISYNQVIADLGDIFSLKDTPLTDGRTRYMGSSYDNLALLEITGEKKNVEEVALVVFIPQDDAEGITRVTVYVLKVIQNVFPNWTASDEWLRDALRTIAREYNTKETSTVEKVYGNIRMTLTGSQLLGALTLSVTHK